MSRLILIFVVMVYPALAVHATVSSGKHIQQLIEQQKYDEAMHLLEQEYHNRPSQDLQRRISNLKKLADKYDQKQAARIQKMVDRQDWEAAYRLMHEGLKNYSHGLKLKDLREKLRPKQLQRIQDLEAEMLAAKGEWLLKSKTLQEELIKTDPGNISYQLKLERIKAQMISLSRKLSDIGIQALSTRELEKAEHCLSLADRLQPAKETILAMERLDQLRYQEKKQTRERLLREEEEQRRKDLLERELASYAEKRWHTQKSEELVKQIYSALTNSDLIHAKQLIHELREFDKNNSHLRSLSPKLDKAITVKVKNLLEQGNSFYSNGEIAQAKQTWDKALELDPGNEKLRSRVARAKQVLSNLRDLHKKNPAVNQR
jgi:hypothetical protein